MQQIFLRRQKTDNQNSKRWSTPLIDQEEQISLQSPYLTLLTNKLGIPKERAFVKEIDFSFFVYISNSFLENEHV
jgi:hypothetical protein